MVGWNIPKAAFRPRHRSACLTGSTAQKSAMQTATLPTGPQDTACLATGSVIARSSMIGRP